MFVARSALHVAVGIVLYLTDALFLGFLEVLGVGNALAEAVRQPAYKVEITLRSLNLVLTDSLLQTGNVLAVTVGGTVALTGIVMCLFDFLTQFALLYLAVLDVLGILQCKLQSCVLQCCFIGYCHIAAAHTLLCLADGFLDVGLLPSACLLKHFHGVRSGWVELTLHLNTSCIYFAASDGFKFVQGLLGVLQLIVHHDVHHLLHITLDVIVSYAVLYGCKQAFHFLLSQSVQIAVIHQHTRKVGDTFHGGHVKGTLEAHCLAQVGEVATDGTHGIIAQRLVVTMIVSQSGCCCRDTLLQT